MTTNIDEKLFSEKESIGYLTGNAYRAINKRLSKNLKKEGNKVTSEQYGVLKQLWIKEGQTQLDIARKINKDKPGITRLLNNLEKKGFIERRVNEDDKRCNKIYLTPKGMEIKLSCLEVGLQTAEEIAENINKQEMLVCKKVLAKICNKLVNE